MKHLKIRSKLLLGFALVSVLAVVVGLVGAVGLTSADTQYNEMLSRNISAIACIADMREHYLMQRLAIRGILIDLENPEKLEADFEMLETAEANMENDMASYELTIADQADEADYLAAKEAYYSAYETAKRNFIAAADNGDREAAVAAVVEGNKASAVITEALQNIVISRSNSVSDDSAELSANSTRMIMIQITVIILVVICAMALGIYIASIISNPIKHLSDFLVRFGTTGDLSLSESDKKNIAENSENRDEIGQCIKAAVKMASRLIELNEDLSKISNGDLTVEVEALSEKDGLGLAMINMTDSLNAMFGELRAASAQVSSGAEQIAQGSQQLAAGSSQQAASVEEFSNSISEMQEDIQNNAENSINAAKVNEKMGAMIEESVSSMGQMLEAMKGIDESAKNITRVIKVIDDIAFQTNILALNAAVEAARAGQHGKGFAVVADEVRNLASKSAAAAKETAVLIEGSSEKVMEGNQIVDKTNLSLEAVASGSKEALRLIGQVSTASSDQAKAIKEINFGIEQISGVVQENSASAEESAAAAEEMSTQATALNNIMARFKIKSAKPRSSAQNQNSATVVLGPAEI